MGLFSTEASKRRKSQAAAKVPVSQDEYAAWGRTFMSWCSSLYLGLDGPSTAFANELSATAGDSASQIHNAFAEVATGAVVKVAFQFSTAHSPSLIMRLDNNQTMDAIIAFSQAINDEPGDVLRWYQDVLADHQAQTPAARAFRSQIDFAMAVADTNRTSPNSAATAGLIAEYARRRATAPSER